MNAVGSHLWAGGHWKGSFGRGSAGSMSSRRYSDQKSAGVVSSSSSWREQNLAPPSATYSTTPFLSEL